MSRPAKKKRMTPKRIQFCYEYVIDSNGQAAAERAGFAKTAARQMAHEILQIPEVKELIAELSLKAQQEAGVDAAYVLKGSKELFERCMQHKPVLDKDGNQVFVEIADGTYAPAYGFDASGAGKALKLLGDHIEVSAFKPKDEDGRPIDQNWRVTFVDAKSGNTKIIDSNSS